MKSKHLAIAVAIFPMFASYANIQINQACPPVKAAVSVSDLNLLDQFNAGTLQKKIARKEIDPHTLIHAAILENSPEVITFLLNHGVNVDYPDQNGMTPLTLALLNRCQYAVDVLLDYGADVNPSVQWNNMSLLEIAVSMQDWESARKLIDHGSGVNTKKVNGLSLLSQVLEAGTSQPEYIEIAKNMINKGAELGPQEIHFAINYCGYFSGQGTSILELVIQKSADLNTATQDYVLPVVEIARIGDFNIMKLLVKHGADLNKISRLKNAGCEYTALLMAISSGKLERVQFLVELGADVNQNVCHSGLMVSPISFAIQMKQPQIVQYLLQHGARH